MKNGIALFAFFVLILVSFVFLQFFLLLVSGGSLPSKKVISLFLLFFLFLLLAKNYKRKPSLVHKLPPGPWKLPLIGNIHQLALAGSLPHHALRKLAEKYGPFMHLQLGEISGVVVSSPNLAKEVMKTHDVAFAQRPQLLSSEILSYGSTDIAFAPYGDYWRQMRKICMLELLSAKRVQSFFFIREDEVAKLIESIRSSSGSPVNVTKKIFSLVSTFVSRAAFGDEFSSRVEFLSYVKKGVEVAGGFDLADLFPSLKPIHFITGLRPKLEKMHKQLDRILENIINERQEKKKMMENGKGEVGKENLLDVLLRIQHSDTFEIPVTTNNVKAVIWDIFIAGCDASATTLVWALSEMMRNSRIMEKAQSEVRQAFKGKKAIHESDVEELGYLKCVIKETLRLHPPAPLLLPRECKEPTKIDGYEIPIKTKVIVNAWALGRNPNYWYDAESFIPERFQESSIDFKGTNYEYIPFGAGRRMCPGMSFGLANIELALAQLLYHFNWELPDGMKPHDLDMTEAFGIAVGKEKDLHLIPTPYVPSS